MRTLFVMDPLDQLHIEGDSTFMMMVEASRRGWPVWWCTPDDLYADAGKAMARMQSVVSQLEEPFFSCDEWRNVPLSEMDVVWMRKDPPFDMSYVFATYILDLVPPHTVVLNDPASIRNANEKMFALQWAELCPKTLVTREISRARSWAQKLEKVVIKPWDGNGGRGVLVTSFNDSNFRRS